MLVSGYPRISTLVDMPRRGESKLDVDTSGRSPLVDTVAGPGPALDDIRAVAWDVASQRVFVTDTTPGWPTVAAVDLATGARSLVSDLSTARRPRSAYAVRTTPYVAFNVPVEDEP